MKKKSNITKLKKNKNITTINFKDNKSVLSTDSILKRLSIYTERNDLNSLKNELDNIEANNLFVPKYLGYFFHYYWNTYNLIAGKDTLKKYIFTLPNELKNHDFYTSLSKGIAALRYEEILDTEEYTKVLSMNLQFTKPKTENIITIKNTRMFKNLRIGLLSPDFRMHPVGRFILALLKDKLNFQHVSYYAFDLYGIKNPIRETIAGCVEQFYNISNDDDEKISKLILQSDLDILIDLTGDGPNSRIRLLNKRLAPIQISYIGIPASTANYNIDYAIVDKISDPKGISEKYYTEKLLYMNKTFLCYSCEPNESMIQYEPPCIKNGYVTIGSFANPHKYSDRTLKLWKKIMDINTNIHFLIQSFLFTTLDDLDFQRKKFIEYGLDISRIDFILGSGLKEYISNYNKVDFVLDTYPFTGATTTCDALSMSVPIITLAGTKHLERVSASILVNIELNELIAYTNEEYIQKTLLLSNDIEQLINLRKIIRKKFMNSPLIDATSFKVELESKFRDIYISYLIDNNVKIESNTINPSDITKEAISSLYYIKILLSQHDNIIAEIIFKEAYLCNEELCSFLKNAYIDNSSAMNLLNKYSELIKYLTISTNEETLYMIIESILKIISMFIK